MHQPSTRRLRCLGIACLLSGTPACHLIFPFSEKAQEPDASAPDSSCCDQVRIADGPADGPRRDMAPDIPLKSDLPLPDKVAVDTQKPDTWPTLGGKCSKLWLAPTGAVQISATDSIPAIEPSITAADDTFYVAFNEGETIHVRQVSGYGTSLSSTAYLSSTNIAGDPWITYNPNASKLLVTWIQDPVSTGIWSCMDNLYFMLLDTMLTPGPGGSYQANGFGNPSAAPDGTSFLVLAPSTASAWCGGSYHAGCSHHVRPCLYPVSSSGSMSAADCTKVDSISPSTTYLPAIAATGSSSYPMAVIRLWEDESMCGNSTTYNVWLDLRDSSGTWSTQVSKATTSVKARPSLAGTDSGVWMAWSDSADKVKLRYLPYGTSASDYTHSYAREPFLAHRSLSGSPGTTVLVYSELDASLPTDPQGIKIHLVTAASPGGVQAMDVVKESTGQTWNPRTPAVAAGKNGFGVVWVDERNATGLYEVFFAWVGCLP